MTSFQAIRDSNWHGVVIVDGSGIVRSISSGAERILGTTGDEMLNGPYNFFPQPLVEALQEARESKSPGERVHIISFRRADENIPVRVTLLPTVDERNVTGMALLLEDLNPPSRLGQNIRRLDRLANIGLFSASMAHEIKNALVSVKAFADLLVEKDKTNEIAEVMQRETARIETIVNRMLKFAAPSKQAFTEVHLGDVLDHALRMLQKQFEAKSHKLRRSFDAPTDLIHGDQLQLEQAFVNLFLNAIEAMEANGSMSVTTALVPTSATGLNTSRGQHKNCLRVLVEDTGSGILPEHQHQVFDPFFTTKESGTGLGLSITRTIVLEHNGSIEVVSTPNRGTVFQVLLPVADGG